MKESAQEKIDVLSNFEGMFFGEDLKSFLYKKHKIVTKNIGIDKSTKSMKEFLIEPFLLDKYSVAFVAVKEPQLINELENNQKFKENLKTLSQSLEFQTFMLLKQQYFLINGHKFGCTFLAYEKNPQKNHAKALVFCGKQTEMKDNFNHMTRLSQIAKKQCHFVFRNEQKEELKIKVLERQTNLNMKKQHKKKKLQMKKDEKNQKN